MIRVRKNKGREEVKCEFRIRSLRVRNLQSIKDITVNIDKNGVFKLDGKNNIGKSALAMAIYALTKNLPNNSYKFYLRDGSEFFVIDYIGWDGSTVTLSRGAVDYYEWDLTNGESGRADKTGGKVPPELEAYFNLYHEKEKTDEILNLRMKNSVIPFVETTPGDNNFILQKALGTEDFLLGLKHVEKVKSAESKDIKLLTTQVEQEEERLADITSEVAHKSQVLKEVSRYENVLKAEYGILEALEDVAEDMEELAEKERELLELQKRLAQLNMDEAEEGIHTIKELTSARDSMVEVAELEGTLKVLQTKLRANNTEEADECLAVIQEVTELLEAILEMEQMEEELSELQVRMNKVKDFGDIRDDLILIEELKELRGLYEEVEELTAEKEESDRQLELSAKELKDFEKEIGVCPLCGGDVSATHVHS